MYPLSSGCILLPWQPPGCGPLQFFLRSLRWLITDTWLLSCSLVVWGWFSLLLSVPIHGCPSQTMDRVIGAQPGLDNTTALILQKDLISLGTVSHMGTVFQPLASQMLCPGLAHRPSAPCGHSLSPSPSSGTRLALSFCQLLSGPPWLSYYPKPVLLEAGPTWPSLLTEALNLATSVYF